MKIRLTEGDLHKIVRKSVIRALNEIRDDEMIEFIPSSELKPEQIPNDGRYRGPRFGGNVEHFTPYTPEEAESNRRAAIEGPFINPSWDQYVEWKEKQMAMGRDKKEITYANWEKETGGFRLFPR